MNGNEHIEAYNKAEKDLTEYGNGILKTAVGALLDSGISDFHVFNSTYLNDAFEIRGSLKASITWKARSFQEGFLTKVAGILRNYGFATRVEAQIDTRAGNGCLALVSEFKADLSEASQVMDHEREKPASDK